MGKIIPSAPRSNDRPQKAIPKQIKASKEVQQLLQSIKDKIVNFQQQAEETIYIKLPEKILYFADILNSNAFMSESFPEELAYRYRSLIDKSLSAKPEKTSRKGDAQPVQNVAFPLESNPKLASHPFVLFPHKEILDLEVLIKAQVAEMMQLVVLIRRWIETNKSADMNPIREEAQLACTAQLKVTEISLSESMNLFCTYHASRADIVHSFVKHGTFDSFETLICLDKKLSSSMRDYVKDFRSHLTMLYEYLTVNFEYIQNPTEAPSAMGVF